MKAAILGAMAVVIAISAYPAYADDDLSVSLQGAIDDLVEVRNAYLAERAFGDSYLTPEIAAMETVRSAIELYESTKTHQVSVGDQEFFVRHTNPYGPGEVAFDVINSLRSDAEVYPFVLDAATLRVVAEGAFPVTVGLPAIFLSEADRPLEEILEDLRESDGTWVSYDYNDPNTNIYEDKRTWLSMHDGYIFGAGYYETPDAIDRVSAMIRQYDADGEGSFTSISAASGVSFVLDAGTLEVVAHTNPDRSGSDIRDAIDIDWPLESLSDILDNHGSLWLSYQSVDPQPGSEGYIRAYLELHDGYVFASGYGITLESRIQSLAGEAAQLYDLEGTDGLNLITAMNRETNQLILDARDNTIVAYAGLPSAIGVKLGGNFFDQDQETVLQYLSEHSGLWMDSLFVGAIGADELRRNIWVVLHDEYLFTAAEIYPPEAVSVGVVDAAVELYKAYGEEAFDRINWQSVRPEIIYPFVVDAETWETIAHATVPGRVGACCSHAIAESNDLDAVREALEESPGLWLEYTFYNPISERNEYKRVWLTTYDGYTFGAGYYYGNFDQSQSAIDNIINLYETEGKDAAFEIVDAMVASDLEYSFVMDSETYDIVAHGQNPNLVGTNFRDKAQGAHIPIGEIESDLHNDGDTTFSYYTVRDPETGISQPKIVLFQLHDGYIFAAGQSFVVYTR